jgi:hypothetical protein
MELLLSQAKKLVVFQVVRKFPEESLLCSQQSATRQELEADEFSPHPHTFTFKIPVEMFSKRQFRL